MLCYAVRCCAVLCCAVRCGAVLCCAVLCCAVLCCAVLCGAELCCAVLYYAAARLLKARPSKTYTVKFNFLPLVGDKDEAGRGADRVECAVSSRKSQDCPEPGALNSELASEQTTNMIRCASQQSQWLGCT